MKVVVRVDASLLIGSGHVMRCLVLAEELKRIGHDIFFACSQLKGDMRPFITQRGFEVITLCAPQRVITPEHDTDYVSWLQKKVCEDARDFLTAITSADLVITDHYAIGKEWQNLVTEALNCRMLAIDDLARSHKADLILDQTPGRKELDYRNSRAKVLLGTSYALLDPSFSCKRELALSRAINKSKPNVLISMGGIDAPNATLKVLKALYHDVDARITVLLSPRAPHFEEVQAWCAGKMDVTHLEFTPDMASLMMDHDIAIGAPGTTSWERACLGLPNVIVLLADNQKMICEQLIKYNAAIKVDIREIPERIVMAYKNILEHWESIKKANLVLCDGSGVRRVVFEIEQLLNHDSEVVGLEFALPKDVQLVYEWQCHPDTRKYALEPNVPDWDKHQVWMTNKLESISDYFYMVVNKANGNRLGAVRLDRMYAGHYLVSIFIDPNNYGRGIAYKALKAIDFIHPDITVHATVLKENIISQRLFQKARYQKVDDEHYVRRPID